MVCVGAVGWCVGCVLVLWDGVEGVCWCCGGCVLVCRASFNPALSVQSRVERVSFTCDPEYMQICQVCPLSQLLTHAHNMLLLVTPSQNPPM